MKGFEDIMDKTEENTSCCCGGDVDGSQSAAIKYASTEGMDISSIRRTNPWIEDILICGAQYIPKVSTQLLSSDRTGAWKARWGISRMQYYVTPGLYAVGAPVSDSPVLVTSNYKLTFDVVRSHLGGLDAWILVLDTNGINVWCAAGKGTFGTDEIIRRVEESRLADIVSHKRLILPQLGAPGVSAHEVKKASGFRVTYGPVRADDIPAFLENGMKADSEMRRVRFPFMDRLAVIPMELVQAMKYGGFLMLGLLILSLFGVRASNISVNLGEGLVAAMFIAGAVLTGAALVPALLPWTPGRAFAMKGFIAGVVYSVLAVSAVRLLGFYDPFYLWGLSLISISGASFLAMNFTGASTFTSLSGVLKEMKVAVPFQIAGATTGAVLFVVGLFII